MVILICEKWDKQQAEGQIIFDNNLCLYLGTAEPYQQVANHLAIAV